MITSVLLLAAAILLIAACAAFVAVEFALVTVDRATVEREAAAGTRGAAGVLAALRSLSTQLSGAQLGITVTNLAVGIVAQPAIADLVEPPLAGLGLTESTADTVSVVLALALATTLTMVFGELVPKNLAITDPLRTARTVAPFMRAFTGSTLLVIGALNRWANAVLGLFSVEPQEELASARSPEELTSLVRRSRTQGTLHAGTATLLERTLVFGDLRASDVATPRTRMTTVHADDPVAAVLAAARDSGHSRLPVVTSEGIDDVVGMVHVKHALAVPRDLRGTARVADVLVPALFVPTSRQLDELLGDLRRGALQMAVLVDEYGGTDGVVTIEDLVEELVGELADEHDEHDDDEAVELPDGSWSVAGLLRPDQVAQLTGFDVPGDRRATKSWSGQHSYDTIGGLVLHHLGRVPAAGDRVEVLDTVDPEFGDEAERPPGGVWVQVQRVEGTRVDRVLVGRLDSGDAS